MKKRIVGIIAVLLLLVALVMSWRHASDQPERVETKAKSKVELISSKSSPANPPPADVGQPVGNQLPERAQPPAEAKRAFLSIFNARLSLYGKVVDQDGQPVAGADVKIGVADKPWDTGSSYQRTTGPDGLFEITGVKGADIFARVEKEGYYAGNESRRLFQSGEMPTKDAPAIWKLYRKGAMEQLNHHDHTWTDLPMDGTPVGYDFKTKKFVSAGQGQLRAEVKVEGSMQQRFSWWYRISVPSGGLVRRAHEFDFVAPESGYVEVLEGRINATDFRWSAAFNGDYFIRLPNGTFGRVEFSVSSGRDSFSFRIDHAAINPSGGRNLEYDPKSVPPFVRASQP